MAIGVLHSGARRSEAVFPGLVQASCLICFCLPPSGMKMASKGTFLRMSGRRKAKSWRVCQDMEAYEAAYRQRLVKGLARKAASLGYRLEPTAAPAT